MTSSVIISRPRVPDVTKANPPEFLYLKGDEFTDGSLRLAVGTIDNVFLVEERVAGTWVPGDIQHSVATWVIDDTLGEYVLDENGEQVFRG